MLCADMSSCTLSQCPTNAPSYHFPTLFLLSAVGRFSLLAGWVGWSVICTCTCAKEALMPSMVITTQPFYKLRKEQIGYEDAEAIFTNLWAFLYP